MSSNLMEASRQWFRRPADERYRSLGEVRAALLDRTERSVPALTSNKAIKVVGDGAKVALETAEWGRLDFTHWSFGQLVGECGMPTASGSVSPNVNWLRACPGQMVEAALNMGLAHQESEDMMLLAMRNAANGNVNTLRAVTSPSYGRFWDHETAEMLIEVNDELGGVWHVPASSGLAYKAMTPEQQGEQTTLYAGDRNFFFFLVDEGNPIEVKVPGRERAMFRGFFVEGSEVRDRSWKITFFLYDFCCANRIVWGAEEVRSWSLRHTINAPARFKNEGAKMLREYMMRKAADEGARIERAARMELFYKQDPIEWLKGMNFGPQIAQKIIEAAKREEGQMVTLFDAINGITAVARGYANQDARVELEARAGDLFKLAA